MYKFQRSNFSFIKKTINSQRGVKQIDILLPDKWRSPNLNELTPIIFNTGLTHLGSEASKYSIVFFYRCELRIIENYIGPFVV